MMMLAMALALQAAAPAAPTPAPAAADPAGAAGHAWIGCVKGRIDARLHSDVAADALVTEAYAGCAEGERAIRAAIAAGAGDQAAALNVERLRSTGRQLFLLYIMRERGQSAPPAAAQPHQR